MNILTEELWEKFINSDTKKFNGVKFEQLIKIILNRGFNGKWEHTKASWDDAHDFYESSLSDRQKRWAECKMYRYSLSTHVFAKTLVLAVNKDINIIYIFSYSPLVKNAFIHLGSFAAKTGKKIHVFDDIKLEQLIFKHLTSKELKNTFPKLPECQIRTVKPIEIYSSFYNDITTSLSQFSEIENFENTNIVTNRKSLNVFELIIVSNEIENDIDIQIDFSCFFNENNDLLHHIGVINLINLLSTNNNSNSPYLYTKRLACGEVFNIRLYIVPTIAGEVEIPPIQVYCKQCKYTELKKIKIKVEEIDTPPYIGSLNLIESIANEADLRTRITTTVISGDSGVGKSRFSKEITRKLLERNFDVYIIEGKYFINKTFSEFIIELLTQLYKIPNPHLLFSKNDFCYNESYEDGYSSEEKTLIEICVNNRDLKYNEYKAQILEYVYSMFLKRKSALIVDDVQFLNDDSLSFLIDLFKLNNNPGRHLITYIFNTELLDIHSKHFSFYHNITCRKICKCIELKEFSQEETRLFIDSTLQIDDKQKFSYAQTYIYELIVRHIPQRPFYLSQFIELAKERKCISLKNGSFFVDNISRLHELLTCPPDKQIDILKERISNLTNEEKIALYIMGIFGNMDFLLFESLDLIEKKVIDNLIERKFLENDNGILVFYHLLTDNFVIQNDSILSKESKSEINNLLLSKKLLKQNYPLALFYISYNDELFEMALTQINYFSQTTLRNKKYAQAILTYIYQHNAIEPSKYIESIIKVAHIASQNNQRDFLNILKQLWNHLAYYKPTNDNEAEFLIEIIREIGSYLSVFNNFEESVQQLNIGIKRLDELQISNSVKTRLKSRLINRIGVAFKQERRLKEAADYTISGYNLAIASNSKVMECLSLIDLGYIYMGVADKNYLVIKYWEKVKNFSENYYDELHETDSDTAKACKHIQGLIFGIKGEYTTAIFLASELLNIALKEYSAYYELQARRAKIFFEYLAGEKNSLLEEQINDFIIVSTKYNILKFHVFAYHMLAIYYEDISKPELAKKCYIKILPKILDSKLGFNIKSLDIYLLYKDSQRFFIENCCLQEFPLSASHINLLEQIYSDITIYPIKENCLFSVGGKYLSIP